MRFLCWRNIRKMIANNCTVIEKDLRQIADMLLQNQIHVNRPVDYEKGIAGIGVGIDYLVRNDFFGCRR